LRYLGSLNVAGLTLKEDDGDVFVAWKNVAAERADGQHGPDLLDIPDLRVDGLNAKLIIETTAASMRRACWWTPAAPVPSRRARPVRPVRSQRPRPWRCRQWPLLPPRAGCRRELSRARAAVRLQDAKLEFADLSLRPQFAARIHELQGVVTGCRPIRPRARRSSWMAASTSSAPCGRAAT
jgi:hypothetical protein